MQCENRSCREELGRVQQFTDRTDVKEICAIKLSQLNFSFKDNYVQYKINNYEQWTNIDFIMLEVL